MQTRRMSAFVLSSVVTDVVHFRGRDTIREGGAYDIKRLGSNTMPGRVVAYVQRQV